jgi:hypothetical protein
MSNRFRRASGIKLSSKETEKTIIYLEKNLQELEKTFSKLLKIVRKEQNTKSISFAKGRVFT